MKRIHELFLGLVMLSSIGCVSIRTDELVGRYVLVEGGYNERLLLILNKDQTYTLDHSVVFHDIAGRDQGSWELKDGVVELTPKVRGTVEGEMFLPDHCMKLSLQKNGNERSLVSVSIPMIPASTRTRAVLALDHKREY